MKAAADRDPNVERARALLEQRLGELDDAERTLLASTVWMWLRNHLLGYPFGWPPFSGVLIGTPPALRAIRVGLADGDALLRGVESLDTIFTVDVLKRVASETRDVVNADPQRSDQLSAAQNELTGGIDADVTGHAAVIGGAVVVGILIGWGAAEVYHHHIAHH